MEQLADARLNYHHLRYFWAVAKGGNLTRVAASLRVSQSALSFQIRQLEEQLGEALFLRGSRRLTLTEAGKMTLRYAEEIFATGGELLASLSAGRSETEVLRLGAVATLSRNFQESFVAPLLSHPRARLRLMSGRVDDLLERLASHDLDVVLANHPIRKEPGKAWRSRRVARQPVSIVGQKRSKPFQFPRDLTSAPLILPGPESQLRTEFDALCMQLDVRPSVLAEVDDMATMRLLVRDTQALALLPSVVVRDELRAGALRELCTVPDLFETFYAITVERQFAHPLLSFLLRRESSDILGMPPRRRTSS